MFVHIVYVIKDSGIKIMPIMLGRKQNAYLRCDLHNRANLCQKPHHYLIELNSHEDFLQW